MGSYISIHNNTQDVWQVKVGSDEAAIQIASITTTVLAGVASAVATAGATAPLFATLGANGVVQVLGISTAALEVITAAAATVSGVKYATTAVGWAMSMVALTQSQLEKEGWRTLKPGETAQFGKMSLSLWQQGTCVRTRVNPDNNKEVIMENLYMRPIFSGATDNSNLTHGISFWLGKHGVENRRTLVRA